MHNGRRSAVVLDQPARTDGGKVSCDKQEDGTFLLSHPTATGTYNEVFKIELS